ncbi:Hypothetical predicted protein [Olea europaea subsp. europaea]|uniref:Uncharacterized protein n=1 Tax=Olea europaea subsp. europaea TaxID=158383 RepID=A0A8S0T628_OLEEU|nr:Hypothetical predicted protein [Olea europaea subsp. europaea]
MAHYPLHEFTNLLESNSLPPSMSHTLPFSEQKTKHLITEKRKLTYRYCSFAAHKRVEENPVSRSLW